MFYINLVFIGLGARLRSSVPWPILHCGSGSTNEDEGLCIGDTRNQSVDGEKFPVPSEDVSFNNIPSSPTKVCLLELKSFRFF